MPYGRLPRGDLPVRLVLRLLGHAGYSGGSSSNSLIHSAVASLFATIVVSAPIPASIPLQRSRFVRSLFKGADSTRDGRGAGARRLETATYGLNYQRLGPFKLLIGGGQVAEDPAREELLDRAVEAHRGEVGRDVRLERAVLARAVDDRRDHRVRLADLVEMRGAERVGRARDLDDDHLHQLRLVAVGVDDERGDHVELVARRDLLRVDLRDRVEHQLPALGEELVEDLLLRIEVVVDEAVGDACLVGDVGYA